jgi:hypothetical protein
MSPIGGRRSSHLEPGDTLPDTTLIGGPGADGLAIPSPSRNALVLFLLPRETSAWIPYLRGVAAKVDDLQQWYSEVVAVVPGDADSARELRVPVSPLRTAAEAEPVLRERTGVADEQAALLVVDRYGQLYHAAIAERPDQLPGVTELEEWVRFLATQCPECGVIDEPGYGEWALT